MPFKIERFKRNLRSILGSKIKIDSSQYDLCTTPKQKSKYLKELMLKLEGKVGKEDARRIMQGCGADCIGKSVIDRAKSIYKEAASMDDFLNKLNKSHIGGGYLTYDGKVIKAKYTKCYCGSVSQSKENMSITYCYCSTGWYKNLFESVFEKPIKVEIEQSIISGANECKFNIYY